MGQNRVLLVEDNNSIQLIVKSAIESICELVVVDSLAQAQDVLEKKQTFSLILLDVTLPDGDGFDFCKKIISADILQDAAVIFLTGKTEIEDRVHGFSLGADDYIVKPIEPLEFRARVEASFRRKPKIQTRLKKANFEADLKVQKIYRVGKNGEQEDLLLTPIEFRLFVHFLQNEGKILSRKDLVTTVWGVSTHVADHTVDTHISTLRKKIGDSASYLKAVLKKGYCYTATDSES